LYYTAFPGLNQEISGGQMAKNRDRIPTLLDENHKDTDIARHPTEDEVESVKKRIARMKDLSDELERIGVDIDELSHLIALNIHHKKYWYDVHVSKVRARDRSKKTVKRWGEKTPEKYDSKKELRAFTNAAAREMFTRDEAEIAGTLTKYRPYLDRFIYDLKHIFDGKTRRPYRYMAAIFNTFNLHPEQFCEGCKSFDEDKRLCTKKRIFKCPKHTLAREKSRVKMKALGTSIPSFKYPR
jgi:hypothetical protein